MSDQIANFSAEQQKCFQFEETTSSCLEDNFQTRPKQTYRIPESASPPNDNRMTRHMPKYIRQNQQGQFQWYMKQLVLKASCIGLMVGFLIIMVLYDKLFYAHHYYQGTRQFQAGFFGYDFETMRKLPNYNQEDSVFFMPNFNPMWSNFAPFKPQNQNLYHQIKDQNKINRYNLEEKFFQQINKKRVKYQKEISEYQLSCRLLEVNHNVNFKGQIVVEQTYSNKTQRELKEKKERIEKVLKIQKQRYEKRYQISQYMDNQLPFCVVVPSYNNYDSKLYLRNLDSIFMQDYQNYHVVYIDDASPDKTGQYVNKYIEENGIPKDKIEVIINQKNQLALANIYNAITNYCKSGQIVMLLDGDDSFLGRQVMSLFNAVYQENKAGLVYSRYLVITGNSRAGSGGSSRQIPQDFLQQGKFRSIRGFFTSHLLTFYADLFWKISKQDLTYQNGTFFKFSYDVALVTPIIEMLGHRLKYIEETTYEYRYDTGLNDPGWGQMQVDEIIFSKKKPYKRLAEYAFIDDFYEKIEKDRKLKKQR